MSQLAIQYMHRPTLWMPKDVKSQMVPVNQVVSADTSDSANGHFTAVRVIPL